MFQKRIGQEQEDEDRGAVLAVETVRSATASTAAADAPGKPGEKKEEEKVSLFWRVFGGTILSIVALAAVTLYNNLSSGIADLRTELSHEREARAELVKKDEYNNRITSLYERLRAIDAMNANLSALKTEVDGLKERVTAKNTTVDTLKKEVATLDSLRERVSAVEAVKKDVAGLEVQKERLTALAADLKSLREDLLKAQQELEKNKASDLERKTFRDTQAKQLDETLKDIQKQLQDCREKLARLEGSQPAPKSPRPAAPKPDGE